MKVKPEDLKENGFAPIATIKHGDMIPFINACFKNSPKAAAIFIFVLIFPVAIILFELWGLQEQGYWKVIKGVGLVIIGGVLSLALIPMHEVIHLMAYWFLGAKKTAFQHDLSKFVFLSVAYDFVVNRKEFMFVALSPFIFISTILFFAIVIFGPTIDLIAMGMLLGHTSCCSGDFGLLGFFDHHKDKILVTHDDLENGYWWFQQNSKVVSL